MSIQHYGIDKRGIDSSLGETTPADLVDAWRTISAEFENGQIKSAMIHLGPATRKLVLQFQDGSWVTIDAAGLCSLYLGAPESPAQIDSWGAAEFGPMLRTRLAAPPSNGA